MTSLNKVNNKEYKQRQFRNENMFNLLKPNLKQDKGQRIFRPFWNDNVYPQPIQVYEIFVGRLPRDAFEDELIPLFGSLGQIYECRLMMDFSGLSRGFCYVTYMSKFMAEYAIRYLHGLSLRPNSERICCYRSLDNKRIYIEGFPRNKSIDDITRAIINLLPGVNRVILYDDPDTLNLNRGIGFVEFVDHRYAVNARKQLWPSKLNLWQSAISVEWAVPLPRCTDSIVLFVKNLDTAITKTLILDSLAKFISPRTVSSIYRRCNYAILQFYLTKDCMLAFHAFKDVFIDGRPMIPKVFNLQAVAEEKELMLDLQMCEWHARTAANTISHDAKYNYQLLLPNHQFLACGQYRSYSLDVQSRGFEKNYWEICNLCAQLANFTAPNCNKLNINKIPRVVVSSSPLETDCVVNRANVPFIKSKY